MSDADRQRSGSDAGSSGVAGSEGAASPSIGRYLAQQRELRGISIQELCERTRIPRRNIERLESGALDDQLDGFARGFVRTLAEALGLDPAEAVMRLMREPDAADEERELAQRRARRLRLALAAVALALLLVLLGSLTLEWSGAGGSEPAAQADREVTYRSDVVRALAREGQARPVAPAPPVVDEDGAPPPPAP